MSELITIVKLVSDSTMKLMSCLSSTCSIYSYKLPSHIVVILCSLFVQFVNITRAQYLESYVQTHFRIVIFTFLGVVYFSYPFLGYLADVKFTRYRILIFSFFLLLASEVTGLLLTAINATIDAVFDSNVLFANKLEGRFSSAVSPIVGIFLVTGIGFFEANAISSLGWINY